ncbi:tetratricopeptide repeat protein [Prochlorococcus marinus]|uniref:tetratricopeptide repeat protein n=1 Tax=Prochlorococcus marinus TaxID=1219 RepID=UPI0022B33297|nr:tetratricopeptide repeat protein [Prochlorococcus marinus]
MTEGKRNQKKAGFEFKTFKVPFDLEEFEENITLTSNTPSKLSKEQIINQAFKFHAEGNILEAIKYYKYFIDQGFSDYRVFSNYGGLLLSCGKPQEAELSTRKAIELKPDFADAHLNLGSILRDLGKSKEAELSTRKAIELKPQSADAHLNLGSIFKDLGKLQEAELSTRKAIELKPDLADAHLNLGNILRDLGRLQEAELSTRKAIELKPDLADAHLNLGNILRDLCQLEQAEIYQRKAIEIKPDSANAYASLGNVLRDLGKLEQAEIYQRKAIELNPDFANAYSNLGLILIDLAKSKEAEIHIIKANKIEPNSAQFKLNLAICQLALGNITSSISTLELAYKINPKDIQIKCLLSILNGRNIDKLKSLRLEKILNSQFEEKLDWKPLVLHRPIEKELIQKLYTLKTQEASNQDRYPRPIFGNIKGSDYDLFETKTPIIINFKKDLINILSVYFESEIFITDSFFNIIQPKDGIGGGNKIHNHLNEIDKIPEIDISKQKFSLVYYLSIGDQNCLEKGKLQFHQPNQDFLPGEGMIVIFPASKLHSVSYNGKKDRVVIVVNFYIV